MYFQRPEQLLNIFTQLEERNLFLIQNVQETEESLEELKQQFLQTETQMELKTHQLESNLGDLDGKISQEHDKAHALRNKGGAAVMASSQQKLLEGLSAKVASVYHGCGFDGSAQSDCIDMLREVESWLEYLLGEMATLPQDKLEGAEWVQENKRREQMREDKKELLRTAYEERLAKSTARAQAQVTKIHGKQVMFRSAPPRKKKVESKKVVEDEEAEDFRKYFT